MFSALDFRQGFWKIPLHPDSMEKNHIPRIQWIVLFHQDAIWNGKFNSFFQFFDVHGTEAGYYIILRYVTSTMS